MFSWFISKPDTEEGFTTTKFVLVVGTVSILLFGAGYFLNGLGDTIKTVDQALDSSDSEEI